MQRHSLYGRDWYIGDEFLWNLLLVGFLSRFLFGLLCRQTVRPEGFNSAGNNSLFLCSEIISSLLRRYGDDGEKMSLPLRLSLDGFAIDLYRRRRRRIGEELLKECFELTRIWMIKKRDEEGFVGESRRQFVELFTVVTSRSISRNERLDRERDRVF